MKKLMPILILFFIIESCFAHDNQYLSISSVKIDPNTKMDVDKCMYTYFIEINLKNEGLEPVFFWSWKNGWFLNFIFKGCNFVFYQYYKSDMPKLDVLLPKMKIKYEGIIYSKDIINYNSIKGLSIGFKFYDALKFTEDAYHNSLNEKYGVKNKYTIYPDIIWNKKPVTGVFQLW